MKIKRAESGATLIEVLVALAILAIIGVVFLGGLSSTAKAAIVTDERTTATSLARSQLEYVKKLPYVDSASSYPPDAIPSESDYSGYSANITAYSVWCPDLGVQKITVAIHHASKTVLSLEGYKVDR